MEGRKIAEEGGVHAAGAASSEATCSQVLESLPMLCWTSSPDGDMRFVSSRWAEYTGVATERLLGRGWFEVVHPDDVARAESTLRSAALSPVGQSLVELRLRARDGTYRWFEVRAAAEFDALGQPTKLIGATVDVHEMQLAREELRSEREHLARIVAAAPGAFYSCRLAPDGTLSLPHVSLAMQELFDATAEELAAGLATLSFVHPDDRERVQQSVLVSARTLRRWQSDYRMFAKDGSVRWVQGSSLPTLEADGSVQWFGFLQDITERKHMEEVQLRSQKLEAVGTLAGGIAHDFNNMLHAIAGNCALALRQLAPDHPARALLESAALAGDRARDLVHRLLQFSRPSESRRDVLPLQAIVREALRLVRATLPSRIEIHEALDDDDPYVAADATEIHQIILNLAANAAHAIGSASGVLRVQLALLTIEPGAAPAPADLPTGSYAVLQVSDSGCGMDALTAARIFDPFFTTKRVGEGTGLGLSTVHAIMTGLGGAITVHSAPGAGATFTLYFPRLAAPAPQRAAPPDPIAEARGGRVLLVDDEPSIVKLGARTLAGLGYEVQAFTRSREALRAFLADPGGVDLVITDFAMPDLSGLDLARQLLEIRPGLPIVMLSGNFGAEASEEARRLGLRDLLLKPVSMEVLAGAVAAALSD